MKICAESMFLRVDKAGCRKISKHPHQRSGLSIFFSAWWQTHRHGAEAVHISKAVEIMRIMEAEKACQKHQHW